MKKNRGLYRSKINKDYIREIVIIERSGSGNFLKILLEDKRDSFWVSKDEFNNEFELLEDLTPKEIEKAGFKPEEIDWGQFRDSAGISSFKIEKLSQIVKIISEEIKEIRETI